jgi:CubicO group peptidase (beta-lactamase class C family)
MPRFGRILAAAAVLLMGAAAAQSAAPVNSPANPPLGPSLAPEKATTPAPATAHALDATDANAWLDGFMPYALKSGGIPGAVVLVVKDGQVLTERGYGYSDEKTQAPVDPKTTMFRPGSISKLYTWTAVMQQVEAGKLNLDADINQYLDFKIPPRDGKPITLRNLMTHTGGFEETIKHLITSNPKKLYKLGDILRLWVPERIYAPGEVPAYSNYGAALAGYIVQRVAGEPYAVYIDRHILQPLGMEHSTFEQPLPDRFKPFMSKGYMQSGQPPKPYELIAAAPAGSSAISGDDMAKFMIAHLQDGRYGSVQILKPETAKLMHTMQNQPTPPFPGMALGFYRSDKNGHVIIAHGGDSVLFHSDLNLFINDGVGLYISMNSPGKAGAAQTVRSQLLQEFADRYFPAAPQPNLPTLSTAKADAKAVAGTYWASRRAHDSWIVLFYMPSQEQVKALPDGTLEVSSSRTPGGAVKKWREVGPQYWQEVGGRSFLKFVMKNGKVDHFQTSDIPAIEVSQPVPFTYQTTWNGPAFEAACVVLLALLVTWFFAAFARRKYGHAFDLTGRAALLHRLVRGVALLDLVVAFGWLGLLTLVSQNFELLGDNLNPWLHLLQFGSLLAVLGGAVALWNLWVVWGDRARSWWGKLSSVLVALACLDMVWLVFLLHLLGPGVNF